MNELNVSIQPSDNVVMIINQPFSLWVTTTTGLFPVGWFIQNPILLTMATRYKRAQSDFILFHFISPKLCQLNSNFGSEFDFQLNGFVHANRISGYFFSQTVAL